MYKRQVQFPVPEIIDGEFVSLLTTVNVVSITGKECSPFSTDIILEVSVRVSLPAGLESSVALGISTLCPDTRESSHGPCRGKLK